MSTPWKSLNPYTGDDPPAPLTGADLEAEVAYLKANADELGEPHDPEWDRWLAEQATDPSGRP